MNALFLAAGLAAGLATGLGVGCSKPESKPAPAPVPAAPASPAASLGKAPAGQLTRTDNTKVALADELNKHAETVVVFYRGFY